MTTLFQPCHYLVARLLQGCYKVATMLSIPGIKIAVLPCDKVVTTLVFLYGKEIYCTTKRQICTKETSCKKFSSTFVGSIFSACLCVQFHTIIMGRKECTPTLFPASVMEAGWVKNSVRVHQSSCLLYIHRQERVYLCYTGPTLFPAYITQVSYTTLPPL